MKFVILKYWSLHRVHGTDQIKLFYESPELTSELWECSDQYVNEKPSVRYLRSKECFLVPRKEIYPERVRFYFIQMDFDDECVCELTFFKRQI